ncbi:small ribosomal subunit biogenesis GTPase RsgA [Pleionea sp. CnH1-48]|uniref:small ribosomal subunit biogenesis GTPase RsgA n=1 Tax=Pleionea sp. CnH1-48 TaxID=2954494 RepID=UPI002097FB98|nr:small ribosomal subunit biogenesis GTPase RsgA [Pleionea sp. CnH1-48]
MAKRQKLSHQQKRRVQQSQQKKLARGKRVAPDIDTDNLGPLQQGIVISRFGEQADVADSDQQVFRCYLRQNLGSLVSGDIVMFRLDKQQHGIVEAVEERRSELTRPTAHSGLKTIVANIDHIYIVIAPLPDFSSVMLDRYLVACELAGIDTSIILNKVDLYSPDAYQQMQAHLDIYRALDYPVYESSCKQHQGIEAIQASLASKDSILVGQSGVGKSSLINELLPDVAALTGAVSENSRLGTHTTTASKLYFLSGGGHIIDSPGTREFGLWHLPADDLLRGFKELYPIQNQCKFRNCQHLNEPGCAIQKAVSEHSVELSRFESYQSILKSLS